MLLASNTATHNVRAEGCDLPGERHGDWHPSSKKFYHMAYTATLCELAICVDKGECTNHDSVNWQKFQQSPAFTQATDEQKKEIKEYHQDGNGMKGFGGYEALQIVQESD